MFVLIVVVIIVLIILFSKISTLENKIYDITQKINKLEALINKILKREKTQDIIEALPKTPLAADVISKPQEEVAEKPPEEAPALPLTDEKPLAPEPKPEPEPVYTASSLKSAEVFKTTSFAPPEAPDTSSQEKKTDIEFNLGRLWLNKIGIVLFVLGVAFLIAYSFKYFGPFFKILTGYAICALLFYLGAKFEKSEKFVNYGRVLLGGAWAVAYFTTYAMYNFEGSRIIQSQLLDLLLLGVVAAGIIAHSLKYNSETLSALALFIGYITATLGNITYFTLLACSMLAVVTIVLVYKKQWIKIIFAGIALTYLTHLFWIQKQIYFTPRTFNAADLNFLLNGAFFLIYWFIFNAAILLIRNEDDKINKNLSVANLLNFILFFLMVFPDIAKMYPQFKFVFIFAMGVIYLINSLINEAFKNKILFTSNIIAAFFLITFSVPLKLIPCQTTLIWLIEIPFLMYAGLVFDRKILRYFSWALALFLFFKFIAVDMHETQKQILDYIPLAGCVSMAASFWICRFLNFKNMDSFEKKSYNFFSSLATIYLAMFLWLNAAPPWIAFALSLEALIICLAGLKLKDKYFSVYSLGLLLIMAARALFTDNYSDVSLFLKWFIISTEIIVCYLMYFIYDRRPIKDESFNISDKAFSYSAVAIGMFLTGFSILGHIVYPWKMASLGLAGAALFFAGILFKDKVFRIAGMAFVVVSFILMIMFDSANLIKNDITYMPLMNFLITAACYSISRYLNKRDIVGQDEYKLYNLFSAVSLAYFTMLMRMTAPGNWFTVILAIEMVVLVLISLYIKEISFFIYSLVILFAVAFKFIFFDNYGVLSADLKWLIISILLAVCYAFYFLYKKLGVQEWIKENKFFFNGGTEYMIFIPNTAMLLFAVFRYMPAQWISLSMGLAGVLLFLLGFAAADKLFRYAGFLCFAITLFWVIFIDLKDLDIVYKIITFIILGIVFLGVSYFYTKYNIGKSEKR